ncbi:MAG: lysyl oxidase family protein [Patescibacteria group bacterium]|jgi:hypothetical protein
MKKLVVAVVIVLLVGIVSYLFFRNYISRQKVLNQNQKDLLLPDLITSPPEDLYIEASAQVRNIRFSTTFVNQGKGPLEIVGEKDEKRQITQATQRMKKTDGTFEEKEIGEFVLHPDHQHWHVENYVQFQLWSYLDNGEKDELLATTDKMSFCIFDQEAVDLSLENAPRQPQYRGCNDVIQGISVGWSDTYRASFEGQELDIKGIGDGNYLVRTVVNPDQKIAESDYENDEVVVYIEIKGNEIMRRDSP